MYYIDTMTQKLDAFDFDGSTGSITNRRCVYNFDKDSNDENRLKGKNGEGYVKKLPAKKPIVSARLSGMTMAAFTMENFLKTKVQMDTGKGTMLAIRHMVLGSFDAQKIN